MSVDTVIRSVNAELPCDNAQGINGDGIGMEADRSFTEMLASPDVSDADADSDIPPAQATGYQQRIQRMESEVIAAHETIQDNETQIDYLKAQIEILNDEYDKNKKAFCESQKQKQEIKRLYTDNDSLKRDLSQVNGIRKITVNGPRSNPDKSWQTASKNCEDYMTGATDLFRKELLDLKREFSAFKNHMD